MKIKIFAGESFKKLEERINIFIRFVARITPSSISGVGIATWL